MSQSRYGLPGGVTYPIPPDQRKPEILSHSQDMELAGSKSCDERAEDRHRTADSSAGTRPARQAFLKEGVRKESRPRWQAATRGTPAPRSCYVRVPARTSPDRR